MNGFAGRGGPQVVIKDAVDSLLCMIRCNKPKVVLRKYQTCSKCSGVFRLASYLCCDWYMIIEKTQYNHILAFNCSQAWKRKNLETGKDI